MSADFESVLRWILSEGGSVNMYMFHGGTNFGFTAGANDRLDATNESYIIDYSPVVTSYGLNDCYIFCCEALVYCIINRAAQVND